MHAVQSALQAYTHCPLSPTSGGGGAAVMMLGGGDGALCLTEALAPSEYSYFNPAVLSTWAGPQHWKLCPRNTQKAAKGQLGPGPRQPPLTSDL